MRKNYKKNDKIIQTLVTMYKIASIVPSLYDNHCQAMGYVSKRKDISKGCATKKAIFKLRAH